MGRYAIGVDFGTESGRALLVDVASGVELATAVEPYRNGVIDRSLPIPGSPVMLPPDWALQDPEDYLRVFQMAVPAVLKAAAVDPADVIGLGIDFTACTMLPVTREGTPLSMFPEFRANPHAWVKLWKHHAAQPEADRINRVARETGEPWLPRYGGKISSEWFFSKALQILDEAPEVYAAADRLIEAADWVVWRLTGTESRNACTAGYKAMWSKRDGFPHASYFTALDPRFTDVIHDKMSRDIRVAGERAGGISAEAAAWTGLKPGTAVAIANVDAHVAVPAVTVDGPGRMVMIMGTSTCHLVLAPEEHAVPGMCGSVEGGIIPGFFGYEAGQSAVGDHFAWFVDEAVPESCRQSAREQGQEIHAYLQAKAERLRVGESGLLALDWWNGNRSVLVDTALGGLLIGATLATVPEEIYRALVEATAFGTRLIIETFEQHGVPIDEIVACGGLVRKSPFIMQVYADVTGKRFRVSASDQTPALGSAMFGARHNLVVWTGGNVSARDPETGLVAIKPSGVRYEDLTAESMVVLDLDGRIVDGDLKPSSDTASHLLIYRRRSDVNGVVHTHSRYATAFAAVGRPIPVYLTAQADEFGGPIPCARFALIGGDQIAEEVVATIGNSPAVLLKNHGVFTIGPSAKAAVKTAVMVEDIAATVWLALHLGLPEALPADVVRQLHRRYTTVYGQ